MFYYYFAKTLQIFLFPPGVNFLLAMLAWVLRKRYRKLALALIWFSLLSLYLFCTPMVAKTLLEGLQTSFVVLDPASLSPKSVKKASAIVILGGGMSPAKEYEEKYIFSSASLRRLLYGAYLYKKTGLPILVSGGVGFEYRARESEYMKLFLERNFGIPVKWQDGVATNTREEAIEIKNILSKENIHTIYLVTEGYHMERSIRIFKQVGFDVIPAPTDLADEPIRFPFNMLPNSGALRMSVCALHEYVGMAYYACCSFSKSRPN